MIRPRTFLNVGRVVRVWPGPRGRLFLETSNFDSQQFCSPLTYRLQIFSNKLSKPFKKIHKKSRSWQHFKGGFCPLKVTSFAQEMCKRAVCFALNCRFNLKSGNYRGDHLSEKAKIFLFRKNQSLRKIAKSRVFSAVPKLALFEGILKVIIFAAYLLNIK